MKRDDDTTDGTADLGADSGANSASWDSELTGRSANSYDELGVTLDSGNPSAGGTAALPCDESGPARNSDDYSTKFPECPGYEILNEISRGGMGVVFRARQLSANRLVALKVLLQGNLASKTSIDRFSIEAKAAASLEHPGIVPIYEVSPSGATPFYSMALIDGLSLREHLQEMVLTSQSAGRTLLAITDAIAFAHQHDVIHRDLKPANIMIKEQKAGTSDAGIEITLATQHSTKRTGKTSSTRKTSNASSNRSGKDSTSAASEWVPIVTDFGLAKLTTNDVGLTVSAQILGTPSYMAPEQTLGVPSAVDHRCDLYSLGAILYEMLTGRPPFVGSNPTDVMQQVRSVDAIPPSTLVGNIDRDLETICLKCLDKSPERRYQSANDLAAELRRYLAGEPIEARPIGRIWRLIRWSRRNRTVATLIASTAAALLLGTFASLYWASVAQGQAVEARQAEVRASHLAKEAEKQRDSANEQLYKSLVNEARALRQSQVQGWRSLAIESLQHANELDAPQSDASTLCGDMLSVLTRLDCVPQPNAETRAMHTVRSLAFSNSGDRLACASYNGRVTIWDSSSGILKFQSELKEELPSDFARRMYSRYAPMPALDWLGDDSAVLASSWNHGLRMLGVQNPNWSKFGAGKFLQSIDVATASDRIAFGWGDATVTVHDRHTGALLRSFDHLQVSSWLPTALSPDGKSLALVSNDYGVDLYRVNDLQDSGTRVIQHSDEVRGLRFSRDGSLLVSASCDGTARVYHTRGKRESTPLIGHTGRLNDVAISSTNRWIATASDDESIRLWDTKTSQVLSVLKPQIGPVISVALSPDESLLVGAFHRLACYRIDSQKLRMDYEPHDYTTADCVFHPHAPLLITASATTMYGFWDTSQSPPWKISIDAELNRRTAHFCNGPTSASLSPDGRRLIATSSPFTNGRQDDHSMLLWDCRSNSPTPQTLNGHRSTVYAVCFDPLSRHLASIDKAGFGIMWNAKDGRQIGQFETQEYPLPDLVFLDSESFLHGNGNGTLQRRSVETCDIVQSTQIMCESLRTFAFNAALGKIVAGDGKGVLSQIDPQTLEQTKIIETERGSAITELALAPTGDLLLVGRDDGGWSLYNTRSWQRILAVQHATRQGLSPNQNPIDHATFSPDQKYLVFCRGTKQIEVWDLQQSIDAIHDAGLPISGFTTQQPPTRWPTEPHPEIVGRRRIDNSALPSIHFARNDLGREIWTPLQTDSNSMAEYEQAGKLIDNHEHTAARSAILACLEKILKQEDSSKTLYDLADGLDRLFEVASRQTNASDLVSDLKRLSEITDLKPGLQPVLQSYLDRATYHSDAKQQKRSLASLKQRYRDLQQQLATNPENPCDQLRHLCIAEQIVHCQRSVESCQQLTLGMLSLLDDPDIDDPTASWTMQRFENAVYHQSTIDPSAALRAAAQYTSQIQMLSESASVPEVKRRAKFTLFTFMPPTTRGASMNLIGHVQLPLDAETLTGEPYDWNATQGKVVLVDLWAPWCSPCLRTAQRIKKWEADYASDGFVAISLCKFDGFVWNDESKTGSIDRSATRAQQRAAILAYADHFKITNQLGITTHECFEQLEVSSIPRLCVFDRQGTLQWVATGAGESTLLHVQRSIEEWLKKKNDEDESTHSRKSE